MKGASKKQTNKKKSKGGTKIAKRAHLHSWNHAYNLQRKTRTKLRRVQTGPPGSAQGRHLKGIECQCGRCANEKIGAV